VPSCRRVHPSGAAVGMVTSPSGVADRRPTHPMVPARTAVAAAASRTAAASASRTSMSSSSIRDVIGPAVTRVGRIGPAAVTPD
jgi:hypothetical protein